MPESPWSDLPISGDHAAFLDAHAVLPAVAAALGVRTVTGPDGLPEPFAWVAEHHPDSATGLLFPWRTPGGLVVPQYRPDVPVVVPGEKRPRKYLWPKDCGSPVGVVREVADPDVVLMVEGTKQGLAAGGYAPPDASVYSIAGCRSWSTDGIPVTDLGVVDGRVVVTLFDADLETNPDVWEAARKFEAVLRQEGAAEIRHALLAAGGSNGLDDVLGRRPADRRAAYLTRLLEITRDPTDRRAGRLPARPKGKRVEAAVLGTAERPAVVVNDDRLTVIDAITAALRSRWDARELFDFGGVLAERDGAAMRPVTRDRLVDLVQHAVTTVARDEQGRSTYAEPTGTVMSAVLSRARHFAGLDRLAQVPFLREDGTICQDAGYDPATRTYLVDALPVDVPDEPTAQDVAAAVRLLAQEWLGDLFDSMPDEADRANALALVLTPLVRGLVPVAPLGVVNGLQMGVGKNLLADVLAVYATGGPVLPLPWSASDDENRKAILSAFRSGRRLFVFDEAHVVEGPSLARALTAPTYTDRVLGVSTMAEFPNNVTWVSLGNNVEINGDLSRRVYVIRLAPAGADPQNRDVDTFRHPDLKGWTAEHRAELVGAGLTLVRAWHVAGRPQSRAGRKFGSFEAWGGMVGGVLEHAGVRGFLTNLAEWRSESDYETRYWLEHLTWLAGQFGEGEEFRAADVVAVMKRSREVEHPPGAGLADHEAKGYVRELGKAYGRIKGRRYAGMRLVGHKAEGHAARWRLERESDKNDDGVGPSETIATSLHQIPSQQPLYVQEKTTSSRACVYTYGGVGERQHVNPCSDVAEGRRVTFDLEGASAAELWTREEGFLRLAGYRVTEAVAPGPSSPPPSPIVVTTDMAEVVEVIRNAGTVVGHNVMGFDLIALARHHGLDIHELVGRDGVLDTKLVAFLADPPPARMNAGQVERHYSLENVGQRLLGSGKTGDLKALAKEFGGFDAIPTDDPRYVAYLHGDVDVADRLADALSPISDYARREHRVAAIAAQLSLNGFRVDVPLLDERREAGRARRAAGIRRLQEEYGLPTHTKDGKREARAPQNSEQGREAIRRAFADAGAPFMPETATGAPATSQDAMNRMIEHYGDKPAVVELANVVKALAGERIIYETITDHLVGDRVHPHVDMRQASGRWSLSKPGLTVMGKRGGKVVERAVFLPEPGEVIVTADLSQIDARAIAAWSQDPAYIALFEPGVDSHVEVARMVWGDPGRRHDAKAIGHGWNYGMGIEGLMRNAKVERDVAEQFDATMREQFPGLVAWRDEVRAWASSGELLDNGFGRKMRPDPERAWTQGPALMGQGGARDLMMEGLLRLPREVLPMLRAQVHDEIVLSVPVDVVDDVEAAVIDALTFDWAPPGGSRSVSITASLGESRGINWADAYTKKDA